MIKNNYIIKRTHSSRRENVSYTNILYKESKNDLLLCNLNLSIVIKYKKNLYIA